MSAQGASRKSMEPSRQFATGSPLQRWTTGLARIWVSLKEIFKKKNRQILWNLRENLNIYSGKIYIFLNLDEFILKVVEKIKDRKMTAFSGAMREAAGARVPAWDDGRVRCRRRARDAQSRQAARPQRPQGHYPFCHVRRYEVGKFKILENNFPPEK